MSTPPILALFAAGTVDRDAVEWLRLVAALVAVGRGVRVVEVGPGRGVLSGDDLPAEAERTLAALAGFDVVPETLPDPDVLALLAAAPAVLRCAQRTRPGEPALLELGDGSTSLEALVAAGQVVRRAT